MAFIMKLVRSAIPWYLKKKRCEDGIWPYDRHFQVVSYSTHRMDIIPESYAAITLSYSSNIVRISTQVVAYS